MKALFIISNGFEDSEALTTLDLLRRAKIDCDLCSIMNNSPVTSSHNLVVIPDSLYKDIKLEDYDFLVLPGGAHVYKNLHNLEEVSNIINYFYNSNKLIASICAAPSLVSKLGLFDGLKYTCFPGCDFEGAKGKNTGNELEINNKFSK